MKRLDYLISGTNACLVVGSGALGGETSLFFGVDLPVGTTLCLLQKGSEPVLRAFSEDGGVSLPLSAIPRGEVRVLFVKDRVTYDGGLLSVTESGESIRLTSVSGADGVERARIRGMMADLLIRVKRLENDVDELKHGADVIG